MSERLDYYNDFEVRKDAERDQKRRLCDYVVKHLIAEQELVFAEKKLSIFIGPGTTAPMFFEALVSRLGHDRDLTVVSNNLGILHAFEENRQKGQHWSLRLYGEEVDLKNKSLNPQPGQRLIGCLKRAKTSLAVISCASVWRNTNSYCIGAFTRNHAATLKQVIACDSLRTYLIADDWKRLLEKDRPTPEQLAKRENDLHLFASIPDDSNRLTLVIEDERHRQPKAFTGQLVEPALEEWWRKPPQPTCFISYSVKDENQVQRLYADLRKKGIKCWKWDYGTRPGDILWDNIARAISSHAPLILICSKNSLDSKEVNDELSFAFDNSINVISLMTDDHFSEWNPPARFDELKVKVKRCRYINARGWADDSEIYARALAELLECLQ